MGILETTLKPLFTDISVFGITEIFPLGLSAALAYAISDGNERTFIKALILLYLVCFIIGWATQIWMLLVVAFIGGLRLISTKD